MATSSLKQSFAAIVATLASLKLVLTQLDPEDFKVLKSKGRTIILCGKYVIDLTKEGDAVYEISNMVKQLPPHLDPQPAPQPVPDKPQQVATSQITGPPPPPPAPGAAAWGRK